MGCRHAAELSALRAEYEARIAGLRQQMLADARLEVRERLMALAGYATGNTDKDQTADPPAVRETADEV